MGGKEGHSWPGGHGGRLGARGATNWMRGIAPRCPLPCGLLSRPAKTPTNATISSSATGRMQYAEFRAQGLCAGSGVVEAGCKTVVGQRLKQSGMRWTLAGANAMLALRSCILSGGYEDFWEQCAGLA